MPQPALEADSEGAIGLEPGVDLVQRPRIDLIPALLRLSPNANELGLAQHAQVLGRARLAQPEPPDELTHRARPLEQQLEDGAAVGVGERGPGERQIRQYNQYGI